MATLEICSSGALSQKMEDKCKQSEKMMEPQDEPIQHQRLLQLSGFMVEVLDRDEELDEPVLPFSPAVDEESKETWMQHIKFWNRYGWRDSVQVSATRRDLEKLQERLQKYNELTLMGASSRYSSDEFFCRDRNSAIYSGRSSSYSFQSSFATRRQRKRRFYRTAAPSLFVPPS